MYRTSDDLRFVKNREALQRAYIDLVKQKGSGNVSVKELTERARVNRMTFYSHYDAVGDILVEYVDQLVDAILQARGDSGDGDVAALFETATALMRQAMDFFRLVARGSGFEQFRESFRSGFKRIFEEELRGGAAGLDGTQLTLTADFVASGITYAYLDWLAGDFGDLQLDDMIAFFQETLGRLSPTN
ncbi:MAG: TetR/AcrR family transcriptional regulator [Coriobacteriales bacterium]|nr:TetR/AcrR family transcriptional regulator [Coriobacteriales bacterium]